MIYEGPCDTKDWHNAKFYHHMNKFNLKYTKIENSYFKF